MMKKICYNNIDLDCFMQKDTEINEHECHKGVISRDKDGRLRFEEIAFRPEHLWQRNPHIYEGTTINMARRKDGSLKFNFKNVNTKDPRFEASEYAFRVYSELTNALQTIR